MQIQHIYVLMSTLLSICLSTKVLNHGSAFQTNKPNKVPNSHFCFQDFCTCDQRWGWADCSRTFGRLHYIPRLPGDIESLDFAYNNLTKIPSDSFFYNVTQIVDLHLESNGLEYISEGAFNELTSLQTLYLGHNSLTYKAISPVLWAKRLSQLYLTYMNLGPIPKDWLAQKPVPPLVLLDLTGNRLEHLQLSPLSRLDKLQHLVLGYSHIFHITSFRLPQLTHLNLQSNALFDLPESCANGTSMFPMIRVIVFRENKFSAFSGEICLPRLEFLDLSRNPIKVVATDTFNDHRFPKLTTLQLQYVLPLDDLKQFAFRSSSLRMLSLMYCEIHLSFVHPDSFAGLENLEILQISYNQANGVSAERFNRLFSPLKKLKHFSMKSNGLSIINKNTFSTLVALRTIGLSGNQITEIPHGTFDSHKNLTRLSLSGNQIGVIHEATFSKTTRMRLRYLDLRNNPFVCDCNILWFQKWLLSSKTLFGVWHINYTCVNFNKRPLAFFRMTDQACVFRPETNKVIIAFVLISILLLLIVSIVYNYRWHIRLMLAFRGHGEIMRRRLLEENFTYDVFLSSADEDEAWVVQHLLPHLERNQGLRVCFHKRDFVPGKNILDNIVDGVKSSKKYVLVFSKHFALSRWCQFELDLCLGHVLDNDDALVVLLLDEAWSRDLTSTMKAVLHTTTYIRWEERPHATVSFWRRLELAMAEIVP